MIIDPPPASEFGMGRFFNLSPPKQGTSPSLQGRHQQWWRLKWTFTTLSNEVEFMDLTITLKKGAFLANLYEKSLALHLYIPSHSCHPPGCFSGLFTGMVLRIYRLCSLYYHIKGWLKNFYGQFLDRGYPHATINPLFIEAVKRAEECVPFSEESSCNANPHPKRLQLDCPSVRHMAAVGTPS